jgi:hypothetical protein
MLLKNLNARHPSLDPDLLLKYKCLYQGGSLFRDNIRAFVPMNPGEDPAIYKIRKDTAKYTNILGSIIDKFSNQIFTSAPKIRTVDQDGQDIEANEFYAKFKEDVDMQGCDLVTFFKKVFINTCIYGKSFWLAQLPEDDGYVPSSKEEWAVRGLNRVKLVHLNNLEVYNYEIDENGELEWLVFHAKFMYQKAPSDERKLITEQWWIYDREDVTLFEEQYDPGKPPANNKDILVKFKRPHRFKRVPVLKLEAPDGMWILDRGADTAMEHFQLFNAFNWSLRRACFPDKIIKLKSADNPPNPGSVMFLGIDEGVEWNEPSGSGLILVKDQIKDLENQLDKITHQMATSINSDAALGRSGLSKLTDQEATAICCKAYAVPVKEAIEKTYELISEAFEEEVYFSIEGMNQYNFVDATSAINNIKTLKEIGIPSQMWMKEMLKGLIDTTLAADTREEVKEAIRQEIDESKVELETPKEIPNSANKDFAKEGAKALNEAETP